MASLILKEAKRMEELAKKEGLTTLGVLKKYKKRSETKRILRDILEKNEKEFEAQTKENKKVAEWWNSAKWI